MVRITRMTRKRLGELLRDEGLVTDEQIEEALASQRKTGELLGEVLVRLGYVTEFDIAKTIVTQFGLPYLAVKQYFLSDDALRAFPERLMRQHQFVPLDRIGNVITIAVGGLLNFDVLSELEKTSGAHIQVYVSTWSEIKKVIDETFKAKKGAAPAEAEEPAPAEAALPEVSEAELAGMELIAGGTEPGEEAGAGAEAAEAAEAAEEAEEATPAPAKGGKKRKSADDLTELGNMLLGDAEGGGGGGGTGQ